MLPKAKIYFGLAVAFGITTFAAGYTYGTSKLDRLKDQLNSQEVKVVTVEKVIKEIVYQDRTQYLDKVKVVKESVPFIVERPVYKNVCLDADGVKAFNTLMGH